MKKTTKTAILVLSFLILWMLSGFFQNNNNSNDTSSLSLDNEKKLLKLKQEILNPN